MARQSLSPMKEINFQETSANVIPTRKNRSKRKHSPITHLKFLRKKCGYTLETLSEITNISVSYLSRLESGARRLNTDLIRRLSHAFNCDVSELLHEESHEFDEILSYDFASTASNMPKADLKLLIHNFDLENTTNGLKEGSEHSFVSCPNMLKKDAADLWAVKADEFLSSSFNKNDILFLEETANFFPESIVIILDSSEVKIKKIWSVAPTGFQVCNVDQMDDLKAGKLPATILENINLTNINVTYKLVGAIKYYI